MSTADVVILLAAIGAVAGGMAAAVWRRRHGKTGCGGDCARCRSCAADRETEKRR